MSFSLRRASIRARLILLVLVLWLPAMAGLGLQAVSGYETQKDAIEDEMERQALALRFALDAEISRRQTLAVSLAALPSLAASDLATFERVARQVAANTGDTVMLVDREHQYFYSGADGSSATPRRPGSLFVTSGMGISFLERGPLSGRPAIAVLVPEAGHVPPRYNVGVPFPPARVQEIIEQQRMRAGTVLSVIDGSQRVLGRSREPERWIGKRASHPALLEMATAGRGGFVRTTTLDKVSSLTYLSAPGRHGWSTVVATPEETLAQAAWQLALRAVAASAMLLTLGLALAIWAARRIARPVHALERAAGELLARRVPAPLDTGFTEVDGVGRVLHEAGTRVRESEQVLEERVRKASEEARQAEAALFDARKHEAIGRLTGAIAHDFNNLLQTISMGLQVVHRSVPEGRHTRSLQAALAASGRAADQVRQMLAFGRAQELKPQPLNLADLVLRSKDLTDKALGERVRLVARIEPALPALMADPVQLELALLNLVFNARDAMKEHGGGEVTLRASAVDGALVERPGDALVRIDVEDNGPGMDDATLSRVFEPYFTTKPVGAGTGLGLPQVQAFARQSGGDVRISSTPGRGTCVSLFVPVAVGEALAEVAERRHVRRSTRSLRILMAEDDVLVASVVLAALENEKHRVTLCRTADDARTLLATGHAADVLFTDVMMPGAMTGVELVEWCKLHRPDVPALVATGYTARTPSGVWKVLRKPYAIEDLLDALDACAAAEEQPVG